MPVDGSASVKVRADNIGVYNPFFPWWGADHVPYAANNAVGYAYMDTTVQFVKEFLRPFLGTPLEINLHDNNLATIAVYPNPANTFFNLNVMEENAALIITSTDGKVALNKTLSNTKNQIDIINFAKGIYFGRVNYKNGESRVFKVVKE